MINLDPTFRASDRLVGQVVKASTLRAADLGLIRVFSVGIFPGRVIPLTKKLVLKWLPCQALGVIGSTLGLVGPVSICRDWVR